MSTVFKRLANLQRGVRAAAPLMAALLLLAAGCESAPATNNSGAALPADTGAGVQDAAAADTSSGGTDAQASADAGASSDSAVAQDTAGSDGAAKDSLVGDSAVTDSTVADSAVSDSGLTDSSGADTGPKDSAAGDTAASDVKADADADAGPAFTCTTDSNCYGIVFSTCSTAKCVSGACVLSSAADGAACSVAGPCGGSGTCQLGQCAFTSACAPKACSPTALKCGDKITLSAASMGQSSFSSYPYPCASGNWSGADKVYDLASDSTQIAAIELAGTGTWTMAEIPAETLCNSNLCPHASPSKLQLGLQPKKARRLIIDSMGTGSVTLTVTCTTSNTGCGDGKCGPDEACWSCPKDCGACTTCGDGKCEITKLETCSSCTKDCGACKAPCPAGSTKGCAGNPCEACVCATDSFCCSTSWDSTCASECTSCNTLSCGDGKCTQEEKELGCVQDCPKTAGCGDGTCGGTETCSSCVKDCGMCPSKGVAVCGDKTCQSTENCATCPGDCGKCGDYACVCKNDGFCCKTKFDSTCATACGKCAGGPCPVSSCGDGLCNGGETCDSCSSDCGACKCGDGKCSVGEDCAKCPGDCGACKCGDGKCTTGEDCAKCPGDCGACKCGNGKCEPGETATSCAADCAIAYGCKGKCGKSSKEPDGTSCYCDDYCVESDDCCSDYTTYCP